MDNPKMFEKINYEKDRIYSEAIRWAMANGITDKRRLDDYRAGMSVGMNGIVFALDKNGYLHEREAD